MITNATSMMPLSTGTSVISMTKFFLFFNVSMSGALVLVSTSCNVTVSLSCNNALAKSSNFTVWSTESGRLAVTTSRRVSMIND